MPIVHTLTPYFDFLYKFTPKKALRVEGQYIHTGTRFRSWLFGLAEMSIAPTVDFEASRNVQCST